MPLYDFECPRCGAAFEEIVSADSDTVPACPECRCGDTVKRMSCHCAIPGSGKNRVPGNLMRGGGAKMERVPLPPQRPSGPSPCSGGGCGSACGGSTSSDS